VRKIAILISNKSIAVLIKVNPLDTAISRGLFYLINYKIMSGLPKETAC
jgi:hypothetical protein